MGRITFDDKVTAQESPLPDENKFTAPDANSIKEAVNAIYDANQTEDGRLMLVKDEDDGKVGSSENLKFADSTLAIGEASGSGIIEFGNGTEEAVGEISSAGPLNMEGLEVNISSGQKVTISVGGEPRLESVESGALYLSGEAGENGQFVRSRGSDAPAGWSSITADDTTVTPFFALQSGAVTGIYRESGESEERPLCTLVGGDPALDLVAWSGTYWGVSVGGVHVYQSFDDVAHPSLCTTWVAVGPLQSPLPTTSVLYGATIQEALEQLGLSNKQLSSAMEADNCIWVNNKYGVDDTAQIGKQYMPTRTVQKAIEIVKENLTGDAWIFVIPGDYSSEALTIPPGDLGVLDIHLMTYPGFEVASIAVTGHVTVEHLEVLGLTNITATGSLTTLDSIARFANLTINGVFACEAGATANAISMGPSPSGVLVAASNIACSTFSSQNAEIQVSGLLSSTGSLTMINTNGFLHDIRSNNLQISGGQVEIEMGSTGGEWTIVNVATVLTGAQVGPGSFIDITDSELISRVGQPGSMSITGSVFRGPFVDQGILMAGGSQVYLTQGTVTGAYMIDPCVLHVNGGEVNETQMTGPSYVKLSNAIVTGIVTTHTDPSGSSIDVQNCSRSGAGQIHPSIEVQNYSIPLT